RCAARSPRRVGWIRRRSQCSGRRCDGRRTRLFHSSLFHRFSPVPRRVPARTRPTMEDSSTRPWRCARASQNRSSPQFRAPAMAGISGTCLAGGFEFVLSCDLRIAEDGEYLIGLPEVNLGLLPGAGGTQRLPRTIGTPAALMHILMGDPVSPREAARQGLVHETVSGKALDRAMEIARRLSSYAPEAVAHIKRLVRN